MVEMADRALGQVCDLPPLPPFAQARDLLADAMPLLDAPSRMAPIEAAARYVRVETRGVWQNFDPDVTPYMIEPVNTVQSRLYKGGAFVGPSQSGKTMALITTALHPVVCDPAPVLVIHMDRPSRDRWVEESLNPVIRNSPEVRDRLGRARDDDTFSRKRFRGMRLNLGYPTPQWLSSAKYRLVAMTDYDHFPPELGVRKEAPEGSPFDMGMQRIKTFLSRGFVFAESTPAWPVIRADWQPDKAAPHEFPPVRFGIVPLYNRGTRGRWYWQCRDCDALFQPAFAHLHYDETLSPRAAGETAEMECQACGALIGPHHKTEFNRQAHRGRGGWLHEAEQGGDLVPMGDSAIRGTEIASWALDGAAATFANWSDLVSRRIEAQRQLEELGEDIQLSRFYYTDVGVPYLRPSLGKDDGLSVQFLRDQAQPVAKGMAPDWVRFVVVSVDVQNTWFPVQVTGFGADGSSVVIDRFDLMQPPADAPGADPDVDGNTRRIQPPRYEEDWAVLEPLADRVIPVSGRDYGLRPIGVVVDFQGAPGVSDNAEKFLLARRRAGEGSKWRLSRGQGGWKVPRIRYAEPERGSGGKAARKIKLLTMGVDRLKDTLASAMLKAEAGAAGAMYLPDWMAGNEAQLDEYVAEERLPDGWDKKAGKQRNEGMDLSVQARALAEHKGLLRIDPQAPPPWAIGGGENINAVPLGTARKKPEPQARAPRRIGYLS
ncbi:terminase gpA endonuclease subunit [Marinovum sp.]|uniref:terminase gpA endonuclease subunit n=1 Tax=Marinovum sp. TaxID=2024839 RepID=UPI002B2785C9|nr:terminase gpA endonuclease subunit [Marinovum sp.]